MRFYLTAVFLFVTYITSAQFSEDFLDGDFTTDPTWTGMVANFEVDAEMQLHLIAPEVEDTSYLAVASTIMDDVTWDFTVKMDFNPSSGNNARVYVVSDQEDLKGPLNGYFVMIGNTADEVSLYRQTGTDITEIIDGLDDAVDMGTVNVRVQVIRDGAGNWELYRDTTGGESYFFEGSTTDNTYTTTNYFGVFCKYTSSRHDLFYFDDLGTPYIDGIAPELESVAVVSDTEIDLIFSEALDPTTAEVAANYNIDGGIGFPISATVDGVSPNLIHLTVATAFTNGETYTITVSDVEDLDGNVIDGPASLDFLYFIPEEALANDVIITELLADPNPVIGLPEAEFVEIYNRSDKIFNLVDWTINDNTTTATFPDYILSPGEYVVICGPDEGILFGIPNFVEVEGLPTLTNSDDDIVIKSISAIQLDSIHYDVDWYNDAEKDDGGWTLERKHLNSPCSGSGNWGASVNPNGGTPGAENSIFTDEDDVTSPHVTTRIVESDTAVFVNFSEPLDTTIEMSFLTLPEVDDISGDYLDLESMRVKIFTLTPDEPYIIRFQDGADCWGNVMNDSIHISLPSAPNQEDVIINEILFNPQTGGTDYVELYNNSNKTIDLHNCYLANWDDDEGVLDSYDQIGENQFLLNPGEYVLLTEDSTAVIEFFPIYATGRFLETDLPTYPNDSGTVFLLDADTLIVDFFHYDEDYHYALLNDNDGKSLERITFGGGMNNPDNWHTASENVDWGTPGYQNSQFAMPTSVGDVSLDPQLFSPDNDGYNDILAINFDLIGTDNVVDVNIYDNQGRPIREIKDNYFMGQTGTLFWDGINDDGMKAAIGTYIVLVFVTDQDGERSMYKLVAVLGGQL